jgi:hypothetical protein
MNRRSAVIVAAGLVFALMAGTVSRAVTLHPANAAAPVRIVVQTPAPTAAGAQPVASANAERD